MDWGSLLNYLHYQLIERRAEPWRRQAQRRGTAWSRRWTRWREARAATKERCMAMTIHEEALYRAAADKIEAGFLDWLKAQHYQEFLSDEAVQVAATERATAALQAEHETRMERLEDEVAARKRQAQDDADAELERAIAKETSRVRREAEGELESARDEVREAQQRTSAAEGQLLELWQQLCPEGKRTYLHDAGIASVDVPQLNAVLARVGWKLAYQKAEASPRLVKVKVSEAHYEAAGRFWLEPTAPAATRSSASIVDPAMYR